MSKRPLTVTLIGWLFILLGAVTLLGDVQPWLDAETSRHWAAYRPPHPFLHAIDPATHLLALLGGFFLLRGHNWARWLLVVWLAFHIWVGALHSLFAGLFHAVLFAVLAYFLLRRETSPYFRASAAEPHPTNRPPPQPST